MAVDEDIIGHTDILSSPSKAKGQANVHYGRTPVSVRVVSKSRRRGKQSPRKDQIEKIKVPISVARLLSSGLKRTRESEMNRSMEDEESTKTRKEVNLKISADNILPSGSRRQHKSIQDIDIDNGVKDDTSDNEYHAEDEKGVESKQKKRKYPQKNAIKPKRKRENSTNITETKKLSPEPDLKPGTPKKGASTSSSSILEEQEFTSPIKKIILSNLKEYKKQVSFNDLKLNKKFTKTHLPLKYTPQYMKQLQTEKGTINFLDTFEGYIDQKRPLKRSKNTMGMAPTIVREDFAAITNLFNKRFQRSSKDKLEALQKKLYPQYWFELSRGFTLLFYGIGSKRAFLEDLAINYVSAKFRQTEILDNQQIDPHYKNPYDTAVPCVIVNGYNPTCNYRDILKDITDIMFPESMAKMEAKYWGNHSMIHIQKMAEYYKTQPDNIKLIIVIHNIDGPSLRKLIFQQILSQLATIKQIAIIASADHVYAPLLWDATKSQNYNFIFHNVTSYEASEVESSFQDVMKLGTEESSTGAEGAKFVLDSLTSNAKKLYKLLLEAQMAVMENEWNNKVAPGRRGNAMVGVEFKKFLGICTADFVVSNEVSLRTILKEFIDHKMAFLKKINKNGSEMLWAGYSYSEMKKLLETTLADVS
ncbi:Origin recognition complex subunit 2 [Maudiozyma exigua]|uniref:Origin recognition complex subunit 2 n=1 Tax=Maudiozyma exigua TaxID=34358 RepID=A0A9P6W058_MAUEX|nr:Origin recognition complex subunit 2 [Kazachstania exigua]